MTNELHRAAEKYDGLEDAVERDIYAAVADTAEDVADDTADEVEHNDSIATRALLQHLGDEPQLLTSDPRWVNGDIVIGRSIGVPEVYKYLEYGTGVRGREGGQSFGAIDGDRDFSAPDPGPPTDAIRKWVEAKGITSYEGYSQPELVEAIQNSIARYGTHPYPFLRPAWHSNRWRFTTEIESSIDNTLQQYARR